ncbi:MAG TPA: OmpA family protein [Chitinophagaceae bacterium]|jgi:outer membrane protein OmpA-like peptidoglycan-associated protein|nr:OmpA family protein [Chitinophagaceae bacterium]
MKKILLLLGLLTTYSIVEAQLLKKLKDKVDKTVDKTVDDATKGKKDKEGSGGTSENTGGSNSAEPATMKTYSKYDFVPGEIIIVYEDFMQDAVGDFPDKWNTNASGEIVTIEDQPGHWLKINKQGVFMPDFIDSLPDNFTFEYDLICDNPGAIWALYVSVASVSDRGHPESWNTASSRFTMTVAPQADGNCGSTVERRKDGTGEAATSTESKQFTAKKIVHISMWRQKERMRVYFNQEKAWDLPKAMSPNDKYNAIVWWLQGPGQNASYYMGNLRLGVGAPDTRKKILEQKKWVTHGILFDVNSATIKPESYGTLKEMADVMKEYTDLKVKIVGHTDADGSDAANLDLSKKRAASVKESLAKEFGIDESRMETDGKGESEPIDKNDTPAGKANNRRVEFIKL